MYALSRGFAKPTNIEAELRAPARGPRKRNRPGLRRRGGEKHNGSRSHYRRPSLVATVAACTHDGWLP